MGEKKMSKINIYILNFFCDVSRAQLNGEFSSKNETEKKIGFSGKNTDFCNWWIEMCSFGKKINICLCNIFYITEKTFD